MLLAATLSHAQKPFSLETKITSVYNYPDFEAFSYNIHVSPATKIAVDYKEAVVESPLRPEFLHEGMSVKVVGKLANNVLTADTLTFVTDLEHLPRVKGSALIEHPAQLAAAQEGWAGNILADGRKLLLSPKTDVKFVEENPLQSLDKVGPGVFVVYRGIEIPDGTTRLERAAFFQNVIDHEEQKLRDRDEPKITPGDPAHKVPAWLNVHGQQSLELVEDEAVNRRVTAIGMSLVPEFSKQIPTTDPTHINWRFYVVRQKKGGIIAALNGTVIIPDSVLRQFENEAQFAAALSCSIATVVQEYEYTAKPRRDLQKLVGWMSLAGEFAPGVGLFMLPINVTNGEVWKRREAALWEQSLRLGLEYTIAAGYDPREGVTAWKRYMQKHPEKGKLTLMSTYLQAALDTTYWKSDFSGSKVGAEDYAKLLDSLR
jgi:hypothetical protein